MITGAPILNPYNSPYPLYRLFKGTPKIVLVIVEAPMLHPYNRPYPDIDPVKGTLKIVLLIVEAPLLQLCPQPGLRRPRRHGN